ncbi:lysine 2,3-aminomutase YodO family protein [Desulfovibrio sp. X2]|uniref:KamA family radical SAM protein n=1 Tax=Desulfovibrio sp. X2 TaxID=941449 RepID=UPI000358C284|nr:KamA family radical SAM protein [Desulfovibrio sp. X2]EPR43664.1 lysine 2,3-aminomutase YodO family protein [Desulfovibrio sp. X2]
MKHARKAVESTAAVMEPPSSSVPALKSLRGGFGLSGARHHGKTPAFVVDEARDAFCATHFPLATREQWSDWRWQIKNRLTTAAALSRILPLSADEALALSARGGRLPFAVTPYYLSLFAPNFAADGNAAADAAHPLRRTMIPSTAELSLSTCETADPLAEEDDSPVPGLVHRYPDRALFLATDFCSAYCRYCTRSRRVGKGPSRAPATHVWEQALGYIARTPAIRDVIVSGGDPLTLSDRALEYLLTRLRAIPHVEVIRLGTKTPMVLPQRITPSLVKMLRRFHPLWASIHCTHPSEFTPESSQALERLADAGLPLGSQTVLLEGVNDSPEVMGELMRGLMKRRVRPYYLYQCDQVPGTGHFRAPLSRGIEIIKSLRGHTSGYAVPHLVVDLPGGGGKAPVLPEYLSGVSGDELTFVNYEGRTFTSHDPVTAALMRDQLPAEA